MEELPVSFGGHTLRVRFDDARVSAAFHTHLRHCPVAQGDTSIAEFHISPAADAAFTTSLNGGVLFPSLPFDLTLQALLTEIISQLVSVCSRGLVIHAAALTLHGNGVILSAQGGSGKSTLAAWLTAEGFQYLTDEVIEVSTDGTRILTFPRSIFLKSGSAFIWKKYISQVESPNFLRFADDAAWVDPQLLHPAAPAAQAEPRLLLFPKYEPAAPLQPQKLTRGEALFRILQNVTNARNLSRHGLDAATRLAEQVTAYTITYSDLPAATQWIRETLA